MDDWGKFVKEQKEIDLKKIISDENLNEEETRKFLDNAFRDGQVKTNGTDIEKILPPMRRFGGGNRAEKKENIIVKVKKFFEKYFGLGTSDKNDDQFEYKDSDETNSDSLDMVAEKEEKYKCMQKYILNPRERIPNYFFLKNCTFSLIIYYIDNIPSIILNL